ncbi:hypothetical protein FKW77_001533 [Venturia effusa]|uniref:Uncharacterized protein n=1 Tax=Venturia effusa TaxID=50376 RepID=A0A517L6N6_9PEZI|nr:hypothetical protein FKW77_001533 [Venturia effusa]
MASAMDIEYFNSSDALEPPVEPAHDDDGRSSVLALQKLTTNAMSLRMASKEGWSNLEFTRSKASHSQQQDRARCVRMWTTFYSVTLGKPLTRTPTGNDLDKIPGACIRAGLFTDKLPTSHDIRRGGILDIAFLSKKDKDMSVHIEGAGNILNHAYDKRTQKVVQGYIGGSLHGQLLENRLTSEARDLHSIPFVTTTVDGNRSRKRKNTKAEIDDQVKTMRLDPTKKLDREKAGKTLNAERHKQWYRETTLDVDVGSRSAPPPLPSANTSQFTGNSISVPGRVDANSLTIPSAPSESNMLTAYETPPSFSDRAHTESRQALQIDDTVDESLIDPQILQLSQLFIGDGRAAEAPDIQVTGDGNDDGDGDEEPVDGELEQNLQEIDNALESQIPSNASILAEHTGSALEFIRYFSKINEYRCDHSSPIPPPSDGSREPRSAICIRIQVSQFDPWLSIYVS